MSPKHPLLAITVSSGAGTTTVMSSFVNIFRREGLKAHLVEGDAFHRFNRLEVRQEMKDAEARGDKNYSHFGPAANLFKELEDLFRNYGETGTGRTRKYLHDLGEAAPYKQDPGTFTAWDDVPQGTDLLFYEGLPGAVVDGDVDIAKYADLRVGVLPIIHPECIHKRDRYQRTRR